MWSSLKKIEQLNQLQRLRDSRSELSIRIPQLTGVGVTPACNPQFQFGTATFDNARLSTAQKELMETCVSKPALLLYHGMGTGKTLTSFLVSYTLLSKGLITHVFYLLPDALITDYENEIVKFGATELNKDTVLPVGYQEFLKYMEGSLDKSRRDEIFVFIQKARHLCIFMDEVHRVLMMNSDIASSASYSDAQRLDDGAVDVRRNSYARMLHFIRRQPKRLYMLTGTPIVDDLHDCSVLFNILSTVAKGYEQFPARRKDFFDMSCEFDAVAHNLWCERHKLGSVHQNAAISGNALTTTLSRELFPRASAFIISLVTTDPMFSTPLLMGVSPTTLINITKFMYFDMTYKPGANQHIREQVDLAKSMPALYTKLKDETAKSVSEYVNFYDLKFTKDRADKANFPATKVETVWSPYTMPQILMHFRRKFNKYYGVSSSDMIDLLDNRAFRSDKPDATASFTLRSVPPDMFTNLESSNKIRIADVLKRRGVDCRVENENVVVFGGECSESISVFHVLRNSSEFYDIFKDSPTISNPNFYGVGKVDFYLHPHNPQYDGKDDGVGDESRNGLEHVWKLYLYTSEIALFTDTTFIQETTFTELIGNVRHATINCVSPLQRNIQWRKYDILYGERGSVFASLTPIDIKGLTLPADLPTSFSNECIEYPSDDKRPTQIEMLREHHFKNQQALRVPPTFEGSLQAIKNFFGDADARYANDDYNGLKIGNMFVDGVYPFKFEAIYQLLRSRDTSSFTPFNAKHNTAEIQVRPTDAQIQSHAERNIDIHAQQEGHSVADAENHGNEEDDDESEPPPLEMSEPEFRGSLSMFNQTNLPDASGLYAQGQNYDFLVKKGVMVASSLKASLKNLTEPEKPHTFFSSPSTDDFNDYAAMYTNYMAGDGSAQTFIDFMLHKKCHIWYNRSLWKKDENTFTKETNLENVKYCVAFLGIPSKSPTTKKKPSETLTMERISEDDYSDIIASSQSFSVFPNDAKRDTNIRRMTNCPIVFHEDRAALASTPAAEDKSFIMLKLDVRVIKHKDVIIVKNEKNGNECCLYKASKCSNDAKSNILFIRLDEHKNISHNSYLRMCFDGNTYYGRNLLRMRPQIDLVIINRQATEGLSLPNKRQMHILEPITSSGQHAQIMARAVRKGSHDPSKCDATDDMLQEQCSNMFVHIYTHACRIPCKGFKFGSSFIGIVDNARENLSNIANQTTAGMPKSWIDRVFKIKQFVSNAFRSLQDSGCLGPENYAVTAPFSMLGLEDRLEFARRFISDKSNATAIFDSPYYTHEQIEKMHNKFFEITRVKFSNELLDMRTCTTIDTTVMTMLKTSYGAQLNFRDAIVAANELPQPEDKDTLDQWIDQLDKNDGVFPETRDVNLYFVPWINAKDATLNAEINALEVSGKSFIQEHVK